MANDADLVWNEFYKYCLEKIGKEDKTVEMYLQTCMPVSLANGVLLVDVATPFAMEQIRNRYMDRMQKLIAENRLRLGAALLCVGGTTKARKKKFRAGSLSRSMSLSSLPRGRRAGTASTLTTSFRPSSSASQTAFRTPRAWPSPSRPETPTTRSLYGERSGSERRT